MKLRICAAMAVVVMVGCSTEVERLRYDDFGVNPSSNVRLLRDTPPVGDFQSLGEQSWSFYRPGWREPEIGDIWPDLSSRVRSAGGDACLIRYQHVSTWTARSIDVTCDVLKRSATNVSTSETQKSIKTITASPEVTTGRFQYSVDRLLKDGVCSALPPARLISAGPGVETYAGTCQNGDTAVVRCEFGQCKVLH